MVEQMEKLAVDVALTSCLVVAFAVLFVSAAAVGQLEQRESRLVIQRFRSSFEALRGLTLDENLLESICGIQGLQLTRVESLPVAVRCLRWFAIGLLTSSLICTTFAYGLRIIPLGAADADKRELIISSNCLCIVAYIQIVIAAASFIWIMVTLELGRGVLRQMFLPNDAR